MADPVGASGTRRKAILAPATGVFLRYGFKKTSMDDLARAAGLSRQGLYLHFETKEALFKEALLLLIATTRAATRAALANEGIDVEDRILDALAVMHGARIGELGAEQLAELLETATELVGPVVSEMEERFSFELTRLLRRSGIADRWRGAGISAKDLAESLFAASQGVRHRAVSPAEYRERMRVAVRLICRGRAQ